MSDFIKVNFPAYCGQYINGSPYSQPASTAVFPKENLRFRSSDGEYYALDKSGGGDSERPITMQEYNRLCKVLGVDDE